MLAGGRMAQRKYSILLVDDEEIVLRGLKKLLEKEGYDVTTATSGQEALLKFQDSYYDLLITDLSMPGISGMEVLKRVKSDKPETSAIIFTAYGEMASAIDALRYGADEYLIKPCNCDELLLRTESCLQKKETARVLRMHEEIIAATKDMVSMVSPGYVNLIANEAYARMMGKKLDDIIGARVADQFGADFFEERMERYLVDCFAGQACHHQDFFPVFGKEHRFLHFSYAPSFSPGGKVTAAVVTIRDITEYHRMAMELEQSEKRLRLALDVSSDGVWDRDLLTGEVYYGENWVGLLGYSHDEVISQKIMFEDLLHPEDREQTIALVRDHLEGKTERYIAEFRLRTKTGAWQWVLARGKVVAWDASGLPRRFVGTHTNITDRKKVEFALLDSYSSMEEMVSRRTAQLALQKEKLEQVNAALTVLLEKREEDKTDLENQMVTNIKLLIIPYLERLDQSRLDETQKAWLNLLETNLDNVLSPFLHRLSLQHLHYTPTEIQVANLIKAGKTSKEIAGIMNLSPETISNHRKHIRKKSGIAHKKVNLRTVLFSFAES